MNKRKIAKAAADQIVLAAATVAVKKTLTHFAPEMTESHETATKVVSAIAGITIQDAIEKPVHKIVDHVANKIETRKNKKTITN